MIQLLKKMIDPDTFTTFKRRVWMDIVLFV